MYRTFKYPLLLCIFQFKPMNIGYFSSRQNFVHERSSVITIHGPAARRLLMLSILELMHHFTAFADPSFWEANSRSDGKEIARILWDPRINCHGHKNPVHVLKYIFNLISNSSCPYLYLPSGMFPAYFPSKISYAFLISPIDSLCLPMFNIINFITRSAFSVQTNHSP
jgi:hypothetical protein